MTDQVRHPTGDFFTPAYWDVTPSSPSTFYDKVDEDDDAEYLTVQNTLGGGVIFSFTPFGIPSIATDISLKIRVRAADLTDDLTLGYRLIIGGNSYGADRNYAGSFTDYTWTLTTNPKTGEAWTVDAINGVGSNALQYIGLQATGGI